MGPLAGLAAGLGIAALMSHFGMGAEFGSLITMLLFGLVAVFAIRFLMRRFAGGSATPSMATPNGMRFDAPAPVAPAASSWAPAASTAAPVAMNAASSALPAGFDAPAFERIAKMIFIRMQAANDTADLNDLRNFTTPEMFAAVKLDLQDRGSAAQQTDVVRVDAEVLDVATEAQRQIVSVRFHGLIREEKDGVAAPFDEVWHLVRPVDGSHEWAIAGIQQSAVA
jgi:predicted lipid-binding transport protein (Tim44 family)